MKNLLIGAVLVAAVFFVAWKATQTNKPGPARQAPQDAPQEAPRPEAEAAPSPDPFPHSAAPEGSAATPPPVVSPAPPAEPAYTSKTELGTRREECLYLCGKCGKVFSPTEETMQAQVRIQWTDAIDCPYCNGQRTAYFAEACPSCGKIYAQFPNTKRDEATGEIRKFCPQCGTDPVRWVLRIRKARPASPTDPPATVLGPRREDFRFLCRKCGANFSPTPESAQKQTRGQGKTAIDCPLCYGRSCADAAVCCPKCKHVYLAEGAKALCPRCKTDAVEWHRTKGGTKSGTK
ncbi:MAG: hypothetical protein NTV86_18630 [Planctomycetota bacterium]|nr:hypothetical protein [Planctomycetota bacterium]